jgi:hypothetical protein
MMRWTTVWAVCYGDGRRAGALAGSVWIGGFEGRARAQARELASRCPECYGLGAWNSRCECPDVDCDC